MSEMNTSPQVQREALSNLLVAAGRGEATALEQVYGLTSAKLFGICLRISNDRHAAEDILQQVYIKIWQRADSFEPDRASPISWLCTIARNTAIDWKRKDRSASEDGDDAAEALADERVHIGEALEEKQQAERIHRCLAQIDEPKSQAIRRSFFDGLTYAELANRMDVPLGTMKSWVRRGLQQLKKCLDDGK